MSSSRGPDEPTGGGGLVARLQRTGTADPGASVALVGFFAVLAIVIAAPSILTGSPQVGILLVSLSLTITLLSNLLPAEHGRYALWLRIMSLAVALAAVALSTVFLLS